MRVRVQVIHELCRNRWRFAINHLALGSILHLLVAAFFSSFCPFAYPCNRMNSIDKPQSYLYIQLNIPVLLLLKIHAYTSILFLKRASHFQTMRRNCLVNNFRTKIPFNYSMESVYECYKNGLWKTWNRPELRSFSFLLSRHFFQQEFIAALWQLPFFNDLSISAVLRKFWTHTDTYK